MIHSDNAAHHFRKWCIWHLVLSITGLLRATSRCCVPSASIQSVAAHALKTGAESDNTCSACIFASPSQVCLHGTTNQQLGENLSTWGLLRSFSPSQPPCPSSSWLPLLRRAIPVDGALPPSCYHCSCDFSFETITSSCISKCSHSSNEIPGHSLEPN